MHAFVLYCACVCKCVCVCVCVCMYTCMHTTDHTVQHIKLTFLPIYLPIFIQAMKGSISQLKARRQLLPIKVIFPCKQPFGTNLWPEF